MTTMNRTRITAATLLCASLTGLGIGVATPASAQPADPLDGFVRPYDLGPDKSDWSCTYQVRYDETLCVHDPRTEPAPTARKSGNRWWQVWNWFRD